MKLAVVTVLVLLCACKDDPPPIDTNAQKQAEQAAADRPAAIAVIDKHRAKATAIYTSLRAIAKDALAAPAVAAKEAPAAALPELKGNAYSSVFRGGNTLIANPERILVTGDGKLMIVEDLKLFDAEWYLGDKWQLAGKTPADLEQLFVELEGLTHALMVRVREYQPGALVTEGGELRYTPGRVAGDALLYDVATGKRVGAFPFAIAQSGDVHHKVGGDAEAKELERSFRAELPRKLDDALQAYVKGG